jgi:hypothetical protein
MFYSIYIWTTIIMHKLLFSKLRYLTICSDILEDQDPLPLSQQITCMIKMKTKFIKHMDHSCFMIFLFLWAVWNLIMRPTSLLLYIEYHLDEGVYNFSPEHFSTFAFLKVYRYLEFNHRRSPTNFVTRMIHVPIYICLPLYTIKLYRGGRHI